jgi:hypothetical protein
MFFRREKPHISTFQERLDALRRAGFAVEQKGPGRVRVIRNGCAAVIDDVPGEPKVERAGVLVKGQIAQCEHGGYQMFFRTADSKRVPALAEQLKALHAFEEDLREALGLTSLYNTSLGTTCDRHMYDRVTDRDRGVPLRPWQD